jgi:hypothetical protein
MAAIQLFERLGIQCRSHGGVTRHRREQRRRDVALSCVYARNRGTVSPEFAAIFECGRVFITRVSTRIPPTVCRAVGLGASIATGLHKSSLPVCVQRQPTSELVCVTAFEAVSDHTFCSNEKGTPILMRAAHKKHCRLAAATVLIEFIV